MLYAVVSYFVGVPTFETKWILYSWIALIIFLHLAVGYLSGEVAFGNFVVRHTESKIGFRFCMIFLAVLVIYFSVLAYDFARF